MIEMIFIISFWVMGFCCVFWEGMLLEGLGDYLKLRLGEKIYKGLFGCFICACFWWGSLIYWIVWHNSFKEWFIVVIAAMGVNATIAKLAPSQD